MGALRGVLGSVRPIIHEISQLLYEAEPSGKPTCSRDASGTDEQLFAKNNPVLKASEVVSCRSAQTR